MNKCYVKVEGGVGNQLFQIATAYSYCKKYDKMLCIDDSNWTASQGKSPKDYKLTIFKNFLYENSPSNVTQILEESSKYNELSFVEGDISLHGYFQSPKYFNDHLEEFILNLSIPEVRTDFIKNNNVAFHIRRGDYLNYPHIFNIGNTYFKNQFEKFKDYQINVFTDSPDIVCKEFEDYEFNLIQTSSELNDLALIAKHDIVVCSNSSFSWWGSALGTPKMVIVPEKWLIDRDCSDVYRNDMIIEKI